MSLLRVIIGLFDYVLVVIGHIIFFISFRVNLVTLK